MRTVECVCVVVVVVVVRIKAREGKKGKLIEEKKRETHYWNRTASFKIKW